MESLEGAEREGSHRIDILPYDPLERALELKARGEPFALAIVVRAERPSSARPGMKALILSDGTLRGWVGGSCAHPVVVSEAMLSLRDGVPRLISLSPSPQATGWEGVIHHTMTCHSGGSLEIYIEPVLPKPQLLLVGEAPLVRVLAELGRVQGFAVWVADPQLALNELGGKITPDSFVVVATMGTYDEETLQQVVGTPARYIGLVASRRRAESVFAYLASRSVPGEDLQRVKVPAGLDIGAVTPEEIALSIMAEIIQVRRGQPMAAHEPTRVNVATDPICGMSVDIASARYRVDYQGITIYFCSAGCKQTFERDPARYAVAGA